MRQKDIALIIMVIFVSSIVSFVVCRLILPSGNNGQEQVEVVQKINSQFAQPDKRYFNDQSFDPARLVTIGGNTNANPFAAN